MSATLETRPLQPVKPQIKTRPYVGILAVFMGAGLATLNSRLLSIGLPDLRAHSALASMLPRGFRQRSIWRRCSAASSLFS